MCPVCHRSKIELIKLQYTLFRHSGFVDFRKNGTIGRCVDCQLLMNIMTASQEKEKVDISESLAYAKAPITNQTFLCGNGKRVTRFFLQAELLKGFLKNTEDARVLDIGCFHGELLLELWNHFPKAEFHGYDVNKHLEKSFPSKKNFIFHPSDLSKIEGKFDLICMSMSMIYIKDIQGLLSNIRRLLKNGGKLFVQLADVTKNPYSILLGDQYYYFTPTILRNVLNKAGFGLVLQHNEHFPRDIVGIANLAQQNKVYKIEEDESIFEAIKYLDKVKDRLRLISRSSKWCVLGTTTVAAFIDSLLGNQIEFFVDENIYSKEGGMRFRGKKVISPTALEKTARIILPYGFANQGIKKRFCREYHLNHFELI